MLTLGLPLALTASLLLGACGDDDDDVEAGDDNEQSSDQASEEGAGIEVIGDLDTKPEIVLNGQEPVDELIVEDLVVGDGAEVVAGDAITFHYVGVLLDGEQFDASWDRNEPLSYPLANLIPGWQEGIPGMKEGGRRLLVIPGDLAYGEAGRPGIPPNSTLVFVIDVLSVDS